MKLSRNQLYRRIAAIIAAGFFIMAGQGFAAELTEFQLDQITVTASRIAQHVAGVAADVTVITAEQIEAKRAKTLADALDGVTGVLVSRRGGAGDNAIPYILGTDRVVVLLDGKRLNIPQGVGRGASSVDLNSILISENVEKIEIVRGGGSALYGADAVGGVINIVTKKGAGKSKTSLTTQYGTYKSQFWSLINQGSNKDLHWFMTGIKDQSDGHRINSDMETKNIDLRLDKDIDDMKGLSFTYNYFESNGGSPGTLDGRWWPGRNDYLKNSYSFAYDVNHQDGIQSIRFYNNEQDRTYLTSGYTYNYKNMVRVIEYQDSDQVNQKNLLTWGTEWREEQVITKDYIGNTSPRQTNKALYLQDQYRFNEHTSVTFGGRLDNNSTYGSSFLPKVALAHQQAQATTYFASWGKVFKAPKFDDLYTPADPVYGGGNPDLKPETGWTADIGARKKLNETSEATISVFKRELTDAIDWVFVPPARYVAQNMHHLTATGLNVSFGTKLSTALSASIGYTYMDSRDEAGLQKSPFHSFHAGLTLTSGKLQQTVQGRYISEYTVAARFIADITANYAMTKDKSVYFKVNNIFDKQYQEVAGYPAPGRAITLGFKHTI